MKKKLLFIGALFFMLFTKVDALSGSATIASMPDATTSNNYVTISHKINEDQQNDILQVVPSYNTGQLQLVGFYSDSKACNLRNEGQGVIACGSSTDRVPAGAAFVTSVFRIKSDITSDSVISFKYIDGTVESGAVKVTIKPVKKVIKVEKITVDNEEITMLIGDERALNAKVSPDDASSKKLTYEVNNEAVISVSEDGKVTAKGEGKAIVTIKAADDVKKEVSVTVEAEEVPITSIKVEKEIKLKVGEKKSIDLEFEPVDYTEEFKSLEFNSSNEKAVVLDKDNNIIGIASGEAEITIKSKDASANVKVIVEKDAKTTTKKSGGGFSIIAILITAVVTFLLTMGIIFVKGMLARRKELNSDDDDDF